jgi:hypothetical protein
MELPHQTLPVGKRCNPKLIVSIYRLGYGDLLPFTVATQRSFPLAELFVAIEMAEQEDI